MESTLMVILFTIVRLGVPIGLLLAIGEAIRRRNRKSSLV